VALTVLDAGVLIGVLDAQDAHHAATTQALSAAVARGDALAVPASAYAEAQVGPARRGREEMRSLDAFLADLSAAVEPTTRQVATRAAQLRAQHGPRLRLPDALVLATAIQLRADRILTTDGGWPRADVPVELIR
jgi:predicted nucleic acid-binding protein